MNSSAENIRNTSYNNWNETLGETARMKPILRHPHFVLAENLWRYLSPFLIVFGTVGNVITILVLCRKTMWKMASSPYLLALSLADVCVLYTGLLRQWLIYQFHLDVRKMSPASCKIHLLLVYSSVDFSVWILVAVSLERFICVCFPFKAKSICTRRHAKIAMFFILISLVLLNCHFLQGFGSRYDNSTGSPVLVSHCSLLYDEYRLFYNEIWPWVDLSVFSMIPFFIIIVCNICLIARVKRSNRRNQVLPGEVTNGSRAKSSSMTALLVSLNSLFLATTAPISVYLIGYPQWIKTASFEEYTRLVLWWAIVNLLMYLNNSVNFIFYCLSGPKFRRELRVMFARNNRVSAPSTLTLSDPLDPVTGQQQSSSNTISHLPYRPSMITGFTLRPRAASSVLDADRTPQILDPTLPGY